MRIAPRTPARRARRLLGTAVLTGAGMTGLFGFSQAAHASNAGWDVVQSCSGVAGKVTFQPGLVNNQPRATKGTLQATISGCSNANGPYAGTGTLSAALTGTTGLGAENFSGTFTIHWPAASGLNPSTGSLSASKSNGIESIGGTISGGAFNTAPVQFAYRIQSRVGQGTAANPVTSQKFVSSQPLTVKENFG